MRPDWILWTRVDKLVKRNLASTIETTYRTISSFLSEIAAYHYENDETVKAANHKIALEQMSYYLERLDAQVQKNGGYFVGGALSWADFTFVSILDYLNSMIKQDIIEKYDNLKQLKQKVEELPAIKSWIEKRPQSEF